MDWSDEQKKIGTGEGEVPLAPPPPQNLDVRTMTSDLKSLQETGGQAAKPFVLKSDRVDSQSEQKTEQNTNTIPKDQIFEPPQAETSPQPSLSETQPSTTTGNIPPPAILSKKKNKLVPIIIGTIFVIAAAAIGYFIAYPALAPLTIDEKINQTPPQQVIPSEQPPIIETEPLPPPSPQLPSSLGLVTINTHASYFKSPADLVREIILAYADFNSLREIIGSRVNAVPILEEIIVKNENNQVIAFSGLMPLFAPNFFDSNTLNYFENDYTLYAYTNNQGTWLGIIAKLRENANISAIQNQMSKIQRDPDNRNFFLVNPGAMGVWRDGTIKGKPSSLVDFERNGATLSYTWFDRFLLLSTNLNSANEAATRLGF